MPFCLVVKGPASSSSLVRLLAYRVEAVLANLLGMLVNPTHFTPLSVTITSPGTVVSMFPPASAARSTTTDPGFIFATMSFVIMTGALRPGMRAVPMMISTSSHWWARSLLAALCQSSDISLAYPPAPLPSSKCSTIRNSPPRDSICSFAAGRTSKALTIAPIFLADTIAASPATPPPITSTLAGLMRPAAVIWPAKKRSKWAAASTTQRYPERLAWLLRASYA
mmetsp:Transcript_3647/g.5403  ORF Transcript_3647/g.5403 Transcript_3647/m.5403 type:complete len:224 (+) Transcript_3647:98-769(+)